MAAAKAGKRRKLVGGPFGALWGRSGPELGREWRQLGLGWLAGKGGRLDVEFSHPAHVLAVQSSSGTVAAQAAHRHRHRARKANVGK